MTILSILINLLILDVIVIVHEFGHMLFARLSKMRVMEFSVGFGPRLFSFKIGDTIYSLKLILFGGSCNIDGMVEDEEINGRSIDEYSFVNRPIWQRMLTIIGGPLFNILFAFIIGIIMVLSFGYNRPVVANVMEGSSAYEAGLRNNDVILKLDGEKMVDASAVQIFMVKRDSDKSIAVSYERDGKAATVDIKPTYNEEAKQYLLGIGLDNKNVKSTLINAIPNAIDMVVYNVKLTLSSLSMLITQKVSMKQMVGPVGLTQIVDNVVKQGSSVGYGVVINKILSLTLLISVNLGILNLVPFPALDGGRLLMLIIEAIIRRKPNPKVENTLNLVGFSLVMLLTVLVFYNDIARMVSMR